MIKFVASFGLQTYVYTSGIMFDRENQKISIKKTILKEISTYVTKLIFNIEAANSITYDQVMGTVDCFEKMKQSIRDASSYAIVTEAHFVPMKLNIDEIDAVVRLCKDLSVSKLSFLRLVLHGRAQKNEVRIALSDEDLQELKVKLQTIQEQAETNIRIGVPLSTDASCHKCEAANGKLNIKYDGKVFPCEVFKNERVSQGLNGQQPESIYDKPLFDIYETSSYLNLVRTLSQEFSCGKHCETCIGQYLIEESCCNEQ
jgi:MoaA/NifB/PqqE/SkfB family radical SAM enzyme